MIVLSLSIAAKLAEVVGSNRTRSIFFNLVDYGIELRLFPTHILCQMIHHYISVRIQRFSNIEIKAKAVESILEYVANPIASSEVSLVSSFNSTVKDSD